jgi:hypothetical protein
MVLEMESFLAGKTACSTKTDEIFHNHIDNDCNFYNEKKKSQRRRHSIVLLTTAAKKGLAQTTKSK